MSSAHAGAPSPHAVGSGIEWPSDEFEREARKYALYTIPLLLHPKLWVHRRKETLEFLDDRRAVRQMSIDFTYPGLGPNFASDLGFVPISLLRKRVLQGFSVVDETGAAVPVFTRRQNGLIASHILTGIGEALVSDTAGTPTPLDPWVWADLNDVAAEDPPASFDALDRLSGPKGMGSHAQRQLIWGDETVRSLALDLVSNFVLFAHLAIAPGDRRVLKFRYEEDFGELEMRAGPRLGFEPIQLDLLVPALADAESYHFEVEAPEDLVFDGAELSKIDFAQAQPLTPLDAAPPGDRISLYANEVPRGYVAGLVEIRIRLRTAGLLQAAFFITALTTLVLVGGIVLRLLHTDASVDATGGLLVALPAVFATYLVRPGEHRLAQRLTNWVRVLVLVAAVASIAAAAVLAIKLGTLWRVLVWGLGAAASLTASILIGLRYRTTRAVERQVSG